MTLKVIRDTLNDYLTAQYAPVSNVPFYDRESVTKYRETPVENGEPYILLEYVGAREVAHGLDRCCTHILGTINFHYIAPSVDDYAGRLSAVEALRAVLPKHRFPTNADGGELRVEDIGLPSSISGGAYPENSGMIDHAFTLTYSYHGDL